MAKTNHRQNKDREERIEMEIIVDAYGPEEQAMGWYYYLDSIGLLQRRRQAHWNHNGNILLVVGATFPKELNEIRTMIIYASGGDDFAEAAREAAVALRNEINQYR